MKLDQIFTEAKLTPRIASKSEKIEMDMMAAVRFAKEHCSDYVENVLLKSSVNIWRGFATPPSAIFWCDSSNIVRESRFAKFNYYTLMMDNSPEWENFPKRSNSFVCATREARADAYAGRNGSYAMIPVDGALIGVAPAGDIWDSFPETGREFQFIHADEFQVALSQTSDYFIGKKISDKNWDEFSKDVNLITSKLQKRLKEEPKDYDYYETSRRDYGAVLILNFVMKKFGGDMMEFLEWIFSPSKNKFKLSHIDSFISNAKGGDTTEDGGREIWFSGKALAIETDFVKDFKQIYVGLKK